MNKTMKNSVKIFILVQGQVGDHPLKGDYQKLKMA